MKTSKAILLFSVFILLTTSCDWSLRPGPCDASGPVIVYKTKNDYLNNVTVQLSKNGKEITARPGSFDVLSQKPIQLANGYLLKRMIGDAYLSITIEEYSDSIDNWSSEELIKYVIDTDPYLEKYECCECTGFDTANINILILENRLDKCKNIN